MHRLQELVRLHRLGVTERRAAKELRMGRNTTRDYRRAIAAVGLLDGSADDLPSLETLRGIVIAALPPQPAPQQVSTLETWQPRLDIYQRHDLAQDPGEHEDLADASAERLASAKQRLHGRGRDVQGA